MQRRSRVTQLAAMVAALGAAWLASGCNDILGLTSPKHRLPCGNGVVAAEKTCDDGNTKPGDGCSATCAVEAGFHCDGSPSVCAPICGDGVLMANEQCDDGNTTSGDGCSAQCTIEPNFRCTGVPSVCTRLCGNGVIDGVEQCDDGNDVAGDGCDASCQAEHGYACTGEPSVCTTVCGDGIVAGKEECDDFNTDSSDGCDRWCKTEHGYTCTGMPSKCVATCGDGVIASPDEQCDDGNAISGDGCSMCLIDHGFTCTGEPSACVSKCGDGLIGPGEQCDDGNTVAGDGCDTKCKFEAGFKCTKSEPTVCNAICGDGIVVGAEQCDDGGKVSGDGCSSTCMTEPGWACAGAPSTCMTVCGDGIVVAPFEQCDSGNLNGILGGCCTATCHAAEGCEVEPNNTRKDAAARAQDAIPVLFNASGTIRGAITPAGDVDYYVFDLPSDSVVRFETFDGAGGDCSATTQTKLTVFAQLGGPVVSDDFQLGIGPCSAIEHWLSQGSYYAMVEWGGANMSTIASYSLEVDVQPSFGGEAEPNDTAATATSFLKPGQTDGYIAGSHQNPKDVDYYKITVPSGKSVRAEVIEGGAEVCGDGVFPVGIQSELRLYNSNMLKLADVAASGRGGCSLVDGTGISPANPGAHDLPAGTYYLVVTAAPAALLLPTAQFDYRLAVTLR